MVLLYILMVASLVLALLVSVLAIIASTSRGTDWLLKIWNNLNKTETPFD